MTNVQKIIKALREHKNVLLYGPPGTGKSHLMKEVANQWASFAGSKSALDIVVDTKEERKPFSEQLKNCVTTRWVTFHQGYSYEDFILGMRPVTIPGGGFSVEPKPGVLLELAATAKNGGEGILLIDEINRGNTSKIFGEFITLMEHDKRLGVDGVPAPTTVTVTLPYLSPGEEIDINTSQGAETISREFQMPANVFTLASMNSVDKSISPLDTAFRRRFHIINLAPTEIEIRNAVGLAIGEVWTKDLKSTSLDSKSVSILSAALLVKLNRAIGVYLGSDFMLGQWYLVGLKDAKDIEARTILSDLWLYKILPQLIELFHGRDDQLAAILELETTNKVGSAIILHNPSEQEIEYGATGYLEVASEAPSEIEILTFLQSLVTEH